MRQDPGPLDPPPWYGRRVQICNLLVFPMKIDDFHAFHAQATVDGRAMLHGRQLAGREALSKPCNMPVDGRAILHGRQLAPSKPAV